jgi:hypothetical protein
MLMNLLNFSFHLLDMDIVLMIWITCLEWILHVSILNERQKLKMKSKGKKPNSGIQI